MSSKVNIASDLMNTSGTVTAILDQESDRILREHFLVEMLRGQQEPLEDGRTRYVFEVEDPEKMKALWNAIVALPKAQVTSSN